MYNMSRIDVPFRNLGEGYGLEPLSVDRQGVRGLFHRTQERVGSFMRPGLCLRLVSDLRRIIVN